MAESPTPKPLAPSNGGYFFTQNRAPVGSLGVTMRHRADIDQTPVGTILNGYSGEFGIGLGSRVNGGRLTTPPVIYKRMK